MTPYMEHWIEELKKMLKDIMNLLIEFRGKEMRKHDLIQQNIRERVKARHNSTNQTFSISLAAFSSMTRFPSRGYTFSKLFLFTLKGLALKMPHFAFLACARRGWSKSSVGATCHRQPPTGSMPINVHVHE